MNYMIIHSKSRGYALLKNDGNCWQQVSKFYAYYGNLKRFVKEANNPCFYKIIH